MSQAEQNFKTPTSLEELKSLVQSTYAAVAGVSRVREGETLAPSKLEQIISIQAIGQRLAGEINRAANSLAHGAD
ncbi:MAG: hypothetical protein WCK91_01040 [bacterium]